MTGAPAQPVAVVLADEDHGIDLFVSSIRHLALEGPAVVTANGELAVVFFEMQRDSRGYLELIRQLVRYNRFARRAAGGSLPGIYDGEMSYREANIAERETFKSVVAVLSSGFGDCADLVAARCAEPEVMTSGGQPKIELVGRNTHGGRLFHVTITYPDGAIEDPSALLLGNEPWHCPSSRCSCSLASQASR